MTPGEQDLLKEAVISGDVDRVRFLLGSAAVPGAMPPLLGLACRYAGAEMTRFLLPRSSARLTLGRGPFSDFPDWEDYAAYLFPDSDVPEDAEHETLSPARRMDVVRELIESPHADLDALLFDAALYGDEDLISFLEARGVYFHPEKAFDSGALIPAVETSVRRALDTAPPERAARVLRLTRGLLGTPVPFSRPFLRPSGAPLDPHYCDPKLFPTMCEHTNLLKIVSRKQTLLGLTAARNESAVRTLIESRYFNGRENLEEYLRAAQEQFPEAMGIHALLMNRLQEIRSRRKSADFSLDLDPWSRRALAPTWTWTDLGDGTIRINNYKGDELDVAVPERVGRKRVSRVGAFAFSPEVVRGNIKNAAARGRIRSIFIPDGVSLEKGVFYFCGDLQSVRLPEDLREIPPLAFVCTQSLRELEVPDSVETVGPDAFYGAGIRELRFSDALSELGPEAFQRSMLARVSLPARVFSTKKVESSPLYWRKPRLLPMGWGAFAMCAALTTVEFRGDGWILPPFAFQHCHALSRLTIPEGVEIIGEEAFADCGIRRADLPASVSSVGDGAFRGAFALEAASFAGGSVRFGTGVFEDCPLLGAVRLPRAQREIPARMFKGCRDLKTIELPPSVETIGAEAFAETGAHPAAPPG